MKYIKTSIHTFYYNNMKKTRAIHTNMFVCRPTDWPYSKPPDYFIGLLSEKNPLKQTDIAGFSLILVLLFRYLL